MIRQNRVYRANWLQNQSERARLQSSSVLRGQKWPKPLESRMAALVETIAGHTAKCVRRKWFYFCSEIWHAMWAQINMRGGVGMQHCTVCRGLAGRCAFSKPPGPKPFWPAPKLRRLQNVHQQRTSSCRFSKCVMKPYIAKTYKERALLWPEFTPPFDRNRSYI